MRRPWRLWRRFPRPRDQRVKRAPNAHRGHASCDGRPDRSVGVRDRIVNRAILFKAVETDLTTVVSAARCSYMRIRHLESRVVVAACVSAEQGMWRTCRRDNVRFASRLHMSISRLTTFRMPAVALAVSGANQVQQRSCHTMSGLRRRQDLGCRRPDTLNACSLSQVAARTYVATQSSTER